MSDHSKDHYKPEEDRAAALNRLRSAASVSIDPELFEKLYLNPPNKVRGDLRKTFGNPTPIGIGGFLLGATPLACDLMGWRGAGGNGAASVGAFFFMAGLLLIISSIFEFLLGNSFSSIVFAVYGGFWLSFAATLTPSFAAYATYAAEPLTAPGEGLATRGFNASFAFWLVFMCMITFIFLICSVRTNVAFVVLFTSLTLTFALLAAAFFLNADNITANASTAGKLVVGGGACLFVVSLAGWYIFVALMLAVVDFPIQIPVGDLSSVVRGKSERSRV
ncbi:GPR1/FUN34/YaaH-class plasma membrane protein [Sarocladium strictum]|jgi:succinate-acetate transporter protein